MTGYVYIIGAGCGSCDLITVRGLNALKKCDTVIYDALTDSSLLGTAPENAELICVGKRSGTHSAQQEEINALLVSKALEGRTVARLKGGDPFVFGRGGEEISELQKHGISFSVIPGISSCIAVPELAGIPVTHRSVSRGFHVITAHTAGDKQDFSRYAGLDGTTVFLMGFKLLPEITEGLIRGGKPADTPAAVISEGGTSRQRAVRGTLADIAGKAAVLTAPAVIVVGDTVAYDFSGTPVEGALAGVPVTVAGTRKFTGKLASMLENEGADVRTHSHISAVKKREIPRLEGYGCIAFTSSYGAEMFLEHCRANRVDLRSLAGVRIAAVGSGTAGTLENAGLIPDIVPDKYTVGELAAAIAGSIEKNRRVLILRAELGSDEMNRVLDERGIAYDDIRIYDTAPVTGLPHIGCDRGYIVFGSSFGVRAYFENGNTLSGTAKAVCIGAQTAAAMRGYTDSTIITAFPHSAEGVVNAIKGDIKK